MKNKTQKQNNKKKLWLFVIPLIVVASLVSAAIVTDFFSGETTIDVTQPISATGNNEYTTDNTLAGNMVLGDPITITNIANDNRQAQISSTEEEGITTYYVSKLDLTTKDTATWETTTDLTASLYYTLVGDELMYKVETESTLTDYVIIYYPDIDGNPGSWNIDAAIKIGDANTEWTTSTLSESLPVSTDWNDHAKLWLIPSADWIAKSWNPSVWLFEANLIDYYKNTEGIITLLPNSDLTFYPLFDLDESLATGSYTITTSVLPY